MNLEGLSLPGESVAAACDVGGLDSPTVCAVDIGGANLKLAVDASRTIAEPFAMWLDYDQLGERLAANLQRLDCANSHRLGITMTGELADCFASRADGVRHILEQVERLPGGTSALVYSVDGQWFSTEQAAAQPWDVAASNWHALAHWLAQTWQPEMGESPGLVVDIGSTTVDVIPVYQGKVTTTARTDRERLQQRQLVYTGCERTPVAAILTSVCLNEQPCPLMAERFADSLDAYLILGEQAEEPNSSHTADGRPRTRDAALARLARMIGEDAERIDESLLLDMAGQIAARQAQQIVEAIWANVAGMASQLLEVGSGVPQCYIWFTGHGHGLEKRVRNALASSREIDWKFEYLAEKHSPAAARCGPAVAVAELLRQHLAAQAG